MDLERRRVCGDHRLRKLWTDLEPDEAPVVMVVGSETETGQVVLRQEVTRGQGSGRGPDVGKPGLRGENNG